MKRKDIVTTVAVCIVAALAPSHAVAQYASASVNQLQSVEELTPPAQIKEAQEMLKKSQQETGAVVANIQAKSRDIDVRGKEFLKAYETSKNESARRNLRKDYLDRRITLMVDLRDDVEKAIVMVDGHIKNINSLIGGMRKELETVELKVKNAEDTEQITDKIQALKREIQQNQSREPAAGTTEWEEWFDEHSTLEDALDDEIDDFKRKVLAAARYSTLSEVMRSDIESLVEWHKYIVSGRRAFPKAIKDLDLDLDVTKTDRRRLEMEPDFEIKITQLFDVINVMTNVTNTSDFEMRLKTSQIAQPPSLEKKSGPNPNASFDPSAYKEEVNKNYERNRKTQ